MNTIPFPTPNTGISKDEPVFDGPPKETIQRQTMSDDDVIKIIKNELRESANADDELEQNRIEALKYFNCEPNGKEIPGRSQAVDSTVADSIEAVMAQTMPLFSNPDIVQFESVSAEDEQAARIESDACTYAIMNQSNGYLNFQAAIKNALLMRNGIIKISRIVKIKQRSEQYKNLTRDEYIQVLQPTSPHEEVDILSESINTDIAGVTYITCELSRIRRIPRIIAASVPMSRFRFSSDCRNLDLSDANFTCDIQYPKRYELLEQGFPPELVTQLKAVRDDSEDNSSRVHTHAAEDEHYASASEVETVRVYDCTVRIDYDRDGIAELRNIIVGDDDILLWNEPAECNPYAAGSPFPDPDRFVGQSFYDKLKQVQDDKTHVQRQYWDNLNHNNNRRLAVDFRGIEDPDSVLDSKPAGVVKCKRPPAEVVMPIPVDDIGPSCINALDYLDRQRSEKVGASLDMQTQQVQIQNDTAHGAERLISSKEEMAAYILSNLCNTLVRQSFLITHKLLRSVETPLSYKRGKSWNQTNTTQWLEREDVSIDSGMSKGERTVKYNALMSILELQKSAISEGQNNILTDVSRVFNTVAELVRVAGIGHVESFWIDPNSQQGMQGQQGAAQAAQAEQEAQQQLQQTQMQLQAALAQSEMQKAQNGTLEAQIKQLKAVLDSTNANRKQGFEYDKLYEDNATKLAIAGVSGQKQNEAQATIDERSNGSSRTTQQ